MAKRILCMTMALLTVLSLAACSAAPTETATLTAENTAPATTPAPVIEETKSEEKEEVVYDKVETPLTRAQVEALPIANNSMSTDELRQLCIDYVKLSVSFQWVSNKEFSYSANQTDKPVTFYEGNLHGGIPYVNYASGNLYRILEYYDSETGILDVEWFSRNTKLFGTACSGTTAWGWHRVINSAICGWTKDLNASHGLIPVGDYTYDLSTPSFEDEGYEDCDAIAKRNGEQKMYEAYAQVLPADCLVNTGHVRMAAEKPVVVRNPDGTIDGKKSYLVQVEQGLFTNGAYHKRVTSDGTEYMIQGNDGKNADGSPFYYTFEDMFKTGYLPHTFKEFHGQDPVEPGEVTLDLQGESVTYDQVLASTLEGNYTLSDVFTTIYDADGKQVIRYAHRVGNHFTRSITMEKAALNASVIHNLAKAENPDYTIEISCQLSNGEIVTGYRGKLAL